MRPRTGERIPEKSRQGRRTGKQDASPGARMARLKSHNRLQGCRNDNAAPLQFVAMEAALIQDGQGGKDAVRRAGGSSPPDQSSGRRPVGVGCSRRTLWQRLCPRAFSLRKKARAKDGAGDGHWGRFPTGHPRLFRNEVLKNPAGRGVFRWGWKREKPQSACMTNISPSRAST